MKKTLMLTLAAVMCIAAIVSCKKKIDPDNNVPVASIAVSPDKISLTEGQTQQLTATVKPDNAADKTVVWKSSSEAVATVSATGMVQAVAEGTATITASSSDGKVSGSCAVTVTATPVEKIEGSHQDVIPPTQFGGSGSAGDDVSGGSGASHGDEDSHKNGYNYEYGDNTVAVSEAIMEKVSNLTENGFSLPADSQGRSVLGTDDVFVFPASEQFPGGYAAKVTDVTQDGNGYYYTTTLATIDEIFETLHIEQTDMDISPYIEKVLGEDGREIDITKTKAGFSLSIPEIFGGLNSLSIGIGDNVQVSPSAEINFNLDLAADVVDCKLRYAKAKVNASARLSADVAIKSGVEKKWISERLKVVVGAIPIGPVVITPEIYVTFELKLSGEVNMTFSVNYQKAYYAYTYYDGQGGVHSKAGEAEIPDKKDPFAVTGNISGGVEFGPNIGVSLSIYGGALGLSVSFNPHLACTFNGSLPFTMETLANFGRSAMWLSNAYYEPSVTFGFGGSMDYGYHWHKEFELPDNIGLAYSFGKTFMVPKLGPTLDIKTSKGGMALISTTIKNKAWFDDKMYVEVKEGGPNGPVFAKCPFEIPVKPGAEDDEVSITTTVKGLEQEKLYYVDGPFITLSAFGYTKEVEMSPVQDADRYIKYYDPRVIAAVQGIAHDLYNSRDGEWSYCNWDTTLEAIGGYRNVSVMNYDGHIIAYFQLNKDWKAKSISVGNHSSDLGSSFRWRLSAPDGYPVVDKLEIDDPCFESITGIAVSNSIAIHSEAMDEFSLMAPSTIEEGQRIYKWDEVAGVDVDLSGTSISGLFFKCDIGKLKLNDCAKLIGLTFIGSMEMDDSYNYDYDFSTTEMCPKPESIEAENSPQLVDIGFGNGKIENMEQITAIGNTVIDHINMFACVAEDLVVPTWCKNVEINTGLFRNVTADNCPELKSFQISSSITPIVYNISITNCPAFESIGGGFRVRESITLSQCPLKEADLYTSEGGATVRVTNLSQLQKLKIECGSTALLQLEALPTLQEVYLLGQELSGEVPTPVQEAVLRGAYVSYPRKYEYVYEWDGELGKEVWKRTITHTNGFWYPGEPDRHYHRTPQSPNSI